MRTIALVNQKGGCGKTTTAINLAAGLSEAGRRVLLVDLDPQSHSTLGLGARGDDIQRTVYEALLNGQGDQLVSLTEVILPVEERLDLAPSNVILSAFEQKLAGVDGRELRLLKALAAVQDRYDYVLIDCPPSVGLLTFNALRACTEVMVPIEASYFALHGLTRLAETLDVLKDRLGHAVKTRVVVCLHDRRSRFSRDLLEQVKQHFGENVYQTIIHRSVRLKEAASAGRPVLWFARRSSATKDYQSLAREVVAEETALAEASTQQPVVGPQWDGERLVLRCRAGEAQSVSVAGDFSQWGLMEMVRSDDPGWWHLRLPLSPGKYQYRFVVDGQWRPDEGNPERVSNPYGEENSVLTLRNEQEP